MPARDENGFLVVLTTLATAEDARALTRRLVAARLIACGSVVEGVHSIYRWQGNVTEESEALVVLKTQRAQWSALQDAVREHHPYDVPELLALPVEAGLPPYLAWLADETRSPEESG